MGGDDRLALGANGVKRRRDQIGKRFAHAGAGLNDEMAAIFDGRRDFARHLLLFLAMLVVGRAG